MKTALAIALAVTSQAIANTLLSKGMKIIEAGSDGFSLNMLIQGMQSPYIWSGIFLLILFFASFLSALSWADLSFVIPATAPVYVLNVLLAYIFLGEPVSTSRWMGSLLIVGGIILVSLSGRKSGEGTKTKDWYEGGERAC